MVQLLGAGELLLIGMMLDLKHDVAISTITRLYAFSSFIAPISNRHMLCMFGLLTTQTSPP